jgi:DNA-binding CsgD family transcriptional regulator/tetratricopeptide (TPR) repeat protein
MGRAASPVMVGRDAEIDVVMTVADLVTGGEPAVLLVSGEPGVGKSRLVSELSGRAAERGLRVAVGRCIEFGDGVWPLAPLRELLTGLVAQLDPDTIEHVIGGASGVVAALTPSYRAGGAADKGPLAVDRLCELFVGVFDRLARVQPLLLVVEDLHWADATTRDLFSLLARMGGLGPMLLIGTYRPDALDRRHPLRPIVAEISRSSRTTRVELRPLDVTATSELVLALGGEATWAIDIHRESEGNPFVVEELVAARRAGVLGLPETLRDIVLARASALDDASVDVLHTVAVAGSTTPTVIATVTGLDERSVHRTLSSLFDLSLLAEEGDVIRFRHELAREVFAEDLAHRERVALHRRLAISLEDVRPERAGELARHWEAAGEHGRALSNSIAAGRQALSDGAAAEAEGHFRRALDEWDRVETPERFAGTDHPGLLSEAAIAGQLARHIDDAIDLAQQAQAELMQTDPVRTGEVWLLLRDLYRFADRRDECADAIARALELLPQSPPSVARAKALALASVGHWYERRAPEAMSTARQAFDMAELLGDRETLAHASNALSGAFDLSGEPERGLAVALHATEHLAPHVAPDSALMLYNSLCVSYQTLGRFTEIPGVCERAVALARRTGLAGPRGAWLVGHWVAALVVLGRWDEAERCLAEHEDLTDDDDRGLTYYWTRALVRQGRFDEAAPRVERVRALLADGFSAEDVGSRAAVVVEHDGVRGSPDDLITFVDELLTRALRGPSLGIGILVMTATAVLADRAESARARRVDVPVESWVEASAGWIERLESARARGIWSTEWSVRHLEQARAEHSRLCGRSDPDQWAAVAMRWADLGARYDEASGRWRHAEALLAGTRGRTPSARRVAGTELAVARSLADAVPAPPLVAEIDDLARLANLSTAPPDVSVDGDRHGLTARELEVLTLLADGRTNGQIATTLYISPKTASVHVSNILRKLGVANRVEAARIAHHWQATGVGEPAG